MQLHILASGSTGNAILIELGGRKLLIDAGISARRIELGLAQAGIAVSDLDGLLITHEHYDHIKGIPVFIKKHRMPVYARAAAWDAASNLKHIPAECRRELKERLDIGAVKIMPFPISHDAADPVGFCFYYRNLKWVIATDMGVITRGAAEALAYANLAVLEANHDPELLQSGPYPPYLKKRIKSKYGHLSNHDAGQILAYVPRQKVMQVFLAHLSQQNNHPQLAEKTVGQVLQQSGCAVGEEIILHRTYPNCTASWIE
ncbi:MAG: MBL fold metallo-hydrolase [Syntrophomonadaceae bacterium]|nr:MBL fold metallo-hydrolase [Syntrophomonadaceae bacterium]